MVISGTAVLTGAGALGDLGALGVVGVVGVVVGLVVRSWTERRAHRGACWVSVLPPPQADPGGAAVLWAQVAGLLIPPRWRAWLPGRPHLCWEYVLRAPGVITVGVWVPGTVPAPVIASAIRAAWPGARTEITPAGPPFPRRGPVGLVVVGGVLRLARASVLPLAEPGAGVDPLAALLGTAGLLGAGQSARVQILARPVPAARLARAVIAHSAGRGTAQTSGGLLSVVASTLVSGLVSGLVSVLVALVREVAELAGPGGARDGRGRSGRSGWAGSARYGSGRDGVGWDGRPPGPAGALARAADRAVAGKASGSGSGAVVVIRYGAATPIRVTGQDERDGRGGRAQARAQSRRAAHALAASFAAYASGHNRLRRRPLWGRAARVLAARRLRRGDLLSAAELGALAHLPTAEHVPGLLRAGAAAVAPPPQVPGHGRDVRPIGDADAVAGRPVGITVADARHHLWVVGATGTGKSTLLVHGVLADAEAGRAAVVLDPKGDLITEILPRLPEHARRRVVLIDPDRPARGPSGPVWPVLNPLAPHPRSGVLRHGDAIGDAATEAVVTIFSRVFSAAWGFRSDDLLRVACLTVRAGREVPTLGVLPTLLSDPDARARAVAQLPRSSPLREFWGWFDSLSEPSRATIAAPLLNKLRAVLLRPFAERVLCGARPGQTSTVDLCRLLDSGGLLLVRLPKVIGEDTTRLMGSLLVAQVWHAALTRATVPEHARRDASLVLDECQNFLHLPYRAEDMLAESRAYRLSLTLAHQNLDQLTPELRAGISTNARSKIVFGCSPDDAARLARHTEPELGAHDLSHLDAFHAAARLMAHGSEAPAFTLTTRQLPPVALPGPSRPGPSRPPRAIAPRAVPVVPSQGGPSCPTTATTSPAAPARSTPSPHPQARDGSARRVAGPGRGPVRPGPARPRSSRPAPGPRRPRQLRQP